MSLIAQKLISASGGVQEETDDDFNLVTGLYHFDGSNGAQNNTFTGIGPSGASQAWTRNNTPSQGTFSPFSAEEGKWSVYFDGSAVHNPICVGTGLGAAPDDVYAGTSDFTLEFFVFTTIRQQTLLDTRSGINASTGIVLYQNGSGALVWYVGADKITASASAMTAGAWNHVALSRTGGTSRMWINGTHIGSFSDSFNYTNLGNYCIGGPVGYLGTYVFKGHISNFRFIKGTAIYSGSSAITVPTSALTAVTNTKLLTCQSNRYKDNSTVGNTITPNGVGYSRIQPFSLFAPSAAYDAAVNGGSGSFTRSNQDYINATSSNHAIGTSDFTIECWCYLTNGANSGGNGLFSQPSGYGGPALGQWNNTGWQIYHGSSETNISDSGFRQNEWVHVAYVRASNVVNIYQNGVKVTSNISDSTNYTNTTFHIGYYYASAYAWDGFISNFKMSLNAIYTSNFTPPTALLTPTSGGSSAASTKILIDFTNAAIFDQTGKTNIATLDQAQLDTSYKKFGTASAEFDGTAYGDRLVISNYDVAPVGTQSFTVECFAYVTDVSNYRCIYSAGFGIQIYIWTDSKVTLYIGNASGGYDVNGFQSTSTISTNTWTHIAVVRDSSNSTLTIFINGTASGQTSITTDIPKLTGTGDYTYVIGAYSNGNYTFSGYIDEMRITNKARYTSNFTAPTEEFANR
tara:strand:+ start:165 stop:2222 length:2058 start_codon:yes stop_codon:yes gene_type:complete